MRGKNRIIFKPRQTGYKFIYKTNRNGQEN